MVMITSTSVQPSLIFWRYSSSPTKSAPAAVASSSLSGVTKAKTRTSLPVPCGRLTTPRTIWSALRGSTPSLTARSTDSSNFELAISFTSAEASCTEYSFVRSILLSDSLRFFVIFPMIHFN